MKHPEEYVKLYRAEMPYGSIKASPIPHLDTITEFEAKKTKKGYVWYVDGRRHYLLHEDENGICRRNTYPSIDVYEIAAISIVAIRNLYEKELESRKQELYQMMDTVVKELDHVRYEPVNLIKLP